MRKIVLAAVLLTSLVSLNSCTDNSLEELEQNEYQTSLHATDPDDDGTIDPEPIETGSENNNGN